MTKILEKAPVFTANKMRRYAVTRLVLLYAVMIIAASLLSKWSYGWQQAIQESTLRQTAGEELQDIQARYSQTMEDDRSKREEFDARCQGRTNAVAQYLAAWPKDGAEGPHFTGLAEAAGAQAIYLVTADGAAIKSSDGLQLSFSEDSPLHGLLTGHSPATTEDRTAYYAAALDGGWAILSYDATDRYAANSVGAVFGALGMAGTPENCLAFAVDVLDNSFTSFIDHELSGRSFAEVGVAPGTFYDGQAAWVTVSGTSYYVVCKAIDDQFVAGVCMSRAALANEIHRNLSGPSCIFVLVMAAALLYAGILLLEYYKGKSQPEYRQISPLLCVDERLFHRLLPVMALGLVLLLAVTFYAHTLQGLAAQSARNNNKLTQLTNDLNNGSSETDYLTADVKRDGISQAGLVAWMLRQNPALLNQVSMTQLARNLDVERIDIFDGSGIVQVSSSEYQKYSLSSKEEDTSNKFWDMIYGETESLSVLVQQKDAADGSTDAAAPYMVYSAVRRSDDVGFVRILDSCSGLTSLLYERQPDQILEMAVRGDEQKIFSINGEDKTFRGIFYSYWMGSKATDVGMTEAAFTDNYTGYQTLDSVQYLIDGKKYSDSWIYVGTTVSDIQKNRNKVCGISFLSGFLLMLLLLVAAVVRPGAAPVLPPLKKPNGKKITVTLPNGQTVESDANDARWHKSIHRWEDKTPEEKFRNVLSVLSGIGVVAVAIMAYTAQGQASAGSMMNSLLDGNWERGLNIFAVTRIIMVFSIVLVFSWLLRRLLVMLSRTLGAHAVTIGHMLDGLIKYTALIAAMFYSFNLLGIETSTLVTSASVLTVVVGLGAQSLIGDVLAGAFIVLEGEFRVGDIVTVENWRGTVVEIGIRTTKIEDFCGNIKIFNNAAISGVVNMTKKYSVASCDIGIEYGQDLGAVEAVLKQELPKLRGLLPDIKKGPCYDGVVKLADSAVVLRISAECRENKRVGVERALNREVKIIFDRHGINIPFPQMVLHEAPPQRPDAEELPPL